MKPKWAKRIILFLEGCIIGYVSSKFFGLTGWKFILIMIVIAIPILLIQILFIFPKVFKEDKK